MGHGEVSPLLACKQLHIDGLLLKGTRVVITNKEHEAVLKLIHEGHLDLSKCKLHT